MEKTRRIDRILKINKYCLDLLCRSAFLFCTLISIFITRMKCFLVSSCAIRQIAFSLVLLSKLAATNCIDLIIGIAGHHKNAPAYIR